MRYLQKLSVMCRMGDLLAELSTDPRPRYRVGSVVFPVDCSSVPGIGYSGAPAGVPHDKINVDPASPIDGKSWSSHAEINALTKAGKLDGKPHLMYTTLAPCRKCAGQVANAKYIVGVIYREELIEEPDGLLLLDTVGIPHINLGELTALDGLSPRADSAVKWWESLKQLRPQHRKGMR